MRAEWETAAWAAPFEWWQAPHTQRAHAACRRSARTAAALGTAAALSVGAQVLCSSTTVKGSLNLQTLTWGLVYFPFLLFLLVGGSLYLAVAALLSRDKESNAISQLIRQRVMRHCLLYLLLYTCLLGLLAASYANLQFEWWSSKHFLFVHVAAGLTAGRPVFGFIGWLLINSVPQRVCGSCGCGSGPSRQALSLHCPRSV